MTSPSQGMLFAFKNFASRLPWVEFIFPSEHLIMLLAKDLPVDFIRAVDEINVRDTAYKQAVAILTRADLRNNASETRSTNYTVSWLDMVQIRLKHSLSERSVIATAAAIRDTWSPFVRSSGQYRTVLLFWPKYQLGHPENYLFSLP